MAGVEHGVRCPRPVGRSPQPGDGAGGRRLDMGKACLRFRSVEDLDVPLLQEAIASTPVEDYLALYAAARER